MEAFKPSRLKHVRVAGFRSLREVELDLGPVTVLIGANGAGKSNLLSALDLVHHLAYGGLQRFVSSRGGASFLMRNGPKVTEAIEVRLELEALGAEFRYEARLGYGSDESLIFLLERTGSRESSSADWVHVDLGAGHREARVNDFQRERGMGATITMLLRGLNLYHFHDTSPRSALRTRTFNDANSYLRSDGGNLPSYLGRLRDSRDPDERAAWERIVELVRRVAPFIRELLPQGVHSEVSLDWVDDSGEVFGPSHLSDGTLRAIALFTALAQPTARMPVLSCIDEPELGLHPAALELFCSLVSSVSEHRQVILSTQSPAVLDNFEPSSVVVAERESCSTSFKRLNEAELSGWLERYTLSEIYDKNLIGGRP